MSTIKDIILILNRILDVLKKKNYSLYEHLSQLEKQTNAIQAIMGGSCSSEDKVVLGNIKGAENKVKVAIKGVDEVVHFLESWICADSNSKNQYDVSASVGSTNNTNYNPFTNWLNSLVIDNQDSNTNDFQFTSDNNESMDSIEYTSIINSLKLSNVRYYPITLAKELRSSEDIIRRISGGDITEGSCSSLAFVYAGNKGGYDVLDFRDGKSREFFSSRNSIETIANIPGVLSNTMYGTNDIECANNLLNNMSLGKEYYFVAGQHAAIVRKSENNHFEYLELQHPSTGNGWHILDDNILVSRFLCSKYRLFKISNFLIDIDSLSKNKEFLNILGYINTPFEEQKKGERGNVR